MPMNCRSISVIYRRYKYGIAAGTGASFLCLFFMSFTLRNFTYYLKNLCKTY